MSEMTIPPGVLREILDRLRALGDREAGPRDRSRQELDAEIDDMDDDQRHALVALLWVGRGVFGPEDWEEALTLAAERDSSPASDYLSRDPMVADEIALGLEALGHDHLLRDGTY